MKVFFDVTVKGIRRYQRDRKISLSRKTDKTMANKNDEKKDKHRTHNTTLETKTGVTRTQQKPGSTQYLKKIC